MIMMNEEFFKNETVIALKGPYSAPVAALKQARKIFKPIKAILLSTVVISWVIWFTRKGYFFHNEAYLRFNFPCPEQLRIHSAINMTHLLKDFRNSNRRFVEMEPTAVRLSGS